MSKRVAIWLGVVVAEAAALLVGLHRFRQTTYVSWLYCLEARFAELPADDGRLCEWLRAQPGVISAEAPRDGTLLRVTIHMGRNLAGEPPLPDLDAQCAAPGYRAPTARSGTAPGGSDPGQPALARPALRLDLRPVSRLPSPLPRPR
jgi:hypothetical protein